MPLSLRQLAASLFGQRPSTPSPAATDPLAAFRTDDGGLSINIQTCVLRDGSMLIKAPGLGGFAIGLEKVLETETLKSIISTTLRQSLSLNHKMNELNYKIELTEFDDKTGFTATISPLPTKKAPPKPRI